MYILFASLLSKGYAYVLVTAYAITSTAVKRVNPLDDPPLMPLLHKGIVSKMSKVHNAPMPKMDTKKRVPDQLRVLFFSSLLTFPWSSCRLCTHTT